MNRNLVAVAFILSIAHLAYAADDGVQVRALSSTSAQSEQFDREVDQAALSAQDSSIAKLTSLLKKYMGTSQEPILMAKLAELQGQKTTILFRVAHGLASRKTQNKTAAPLNLTAYNKALAQQISTLSTLIAKYPNYAEIPIAYFSRGKAYEDQGNKTAATKDYQYLVKNFPEAEQTSPAYMSLADFAIEANNHPLAITYLKELEKRPEDPHYPFALYKLAWSYYNLKAVSNALSYAEKQVAYYNERFPDAGKTKEAEVTVTSDTALKENTLVDVPLFYFEGVEEKDDRYPAKGALDYFRKLDKSPTLGKMALRFSKLLRSRNMEPELVAFKNQMLEQEWQRPESLEVLIITYEYQQNQRKFTALVESAKDLIGLLKKVGRERILKYPSLSKAQKMILDTAEGLQSVIVKNKQTEQAHELSHTLAALYDAFTQVVVETDPRIPQVHYNLAETLFTIEDFEGATTHYRWIVDHVRSIHQSVQKSVADAPIKAIAAHYEVLRQKKLIPTEVKAVAFSKDKDKKFALDPGLETWISWIDTLGDKLSPKSDAEQFKTWDNFNFEANRAIYVQGDLQRATERMEKFSRKRPQSNYGVPSASLVLDTYIASEDWDGAFEKATAFHKLEPWKPMNKPTDFGKRLYEVAADSLYKKIEIKYHAKDYAEALHDADEFMADYRESARIPDCLSLAGAAALSNGEKARAMDYFSRLIKSDKDPARISEALLARASLTEEKYEFARAAGDYRAYLSLPPTKRTDTSKQDDFRRKALALSWLTGDGEDLKATLENKTICTEKLDEECEKYRAISALQRSRLNPPNEDTTTNVFNRLRKMDSSAAKTLWAAYVLQGAKNLAFRDRNLTLRALGSGWKDLDPLSKFFLLPYVNISIQKAFEMNRIALKDVAPLRANEKYITHRVDSIREIENAVEKVMDLPWSHVRAATLNELASVYQDLSKGLADIPPPKGLSDAEQTAYQDTIRKLVLPFEDKSQDLRSKSFEIASRFAVEDDVLKAITDPFFTENPSQAKKLRSLAEEASAGTVIPKSLSFTELTLDYLPYIEQTGKELAKNDSPKNDSTDLTAKGRQEAAKLLLTSWSSSIRKQQWVQVAFFLQEAKEKKLFPDAELSLIRSVSLASAGARGEALVELEENRSNVGPKVQPVVTLTLAQYFDKSMAAAKAKAFYTQFIPPAPAVVASADKDSKKTAAKSGDRKPASTH